MTPCEFELAGRDARTRSTPSRTSKHTLSRRALKMDPMVGDYVRFKHKRVEITGTVIKRSGARIHVQPEDGLATLWKELSELLPLAPVVASS